MPLYQYVAMDSTRKKRSGLIEGKNEKDAKEKLRDMGLLVSKLSSKSSSSSKQNLKGEALVNFTVQLSQLVEAGLPLYESLTAIEEQSRGEPYDRVLLSLCEQIKSGSSLSDAMGGFPESFDRLYCSMIRAGESIGALDIVLNKLKELLIKQNKLKAQLKSAMIYPAILAVFSIGVICILLGFVVPSIEAIFEGRELNGFTEFVMGASRFFRDYWWALLLGFVSFIALIYFQLKKAATKLWLQRISLKIPLIKTLTVQASLARFSRTLGTLQLGGMTLLDSLRISREVMQNVVLEEEISKAETKIIEGGTLSQELKQSPYIPPLVTRMLKIGEESGHLVKMINQIAEMYETEVERTIETVMAILLPTMIIVMAVIIGCVLAGVLIPLTDISSLTA